MPYFKDTWRMVMLGIWIRFVSRHPLGLHLVFLCLSGQGHPLTHFTCEATLLHNHDKERVWWDLHQPVYLSQQLAYCTPWELSHTTALEDRPWRCKLSVCLAVCYGPTNLPSMAILHCILDLLSMSQQRDFSQALNQKKSVSWKIDLFLADDIFEHLIDHVWVDSWEGLGWNL